MISTLHCHPDTPSPHVRAIRVEMDRLNDGGLAFRYSLTGDLEALRIPAQARAERADGLWRHTCFEAFIGGDGAAYREFNISPAGHWQAYDFTDYRRGRHYPALPAPNLWRRESAMGLVLGCRLPDTALPAGPHWHIALCAVIEAADGDLSYWSLQHPPGRPDFHRAENFALALGRT